jgi:hypothetical protein
LVWELIEKSHLNPQRGRQSLFQNVDQILNSCYLFYSLTPLLGHRPSLWITQNAAGTNGLTCLPKHGGSTSLASHGCNVDTKVLLCYIIHTYIKSRPFPIGVGRDHFIPLATILTHTFRFLHFHQIPHTRSPVSGILYLPFSKTSPIWSRNVRLGLPLSALPPKSSYIMHVIYI